MSTPHERAARLEEFKRIRTIGRDAIKAIDSGQRGESYLLAVVAYSKQLESANARHVLNHIENICPECGHTKTEDGCANCLKTSPTLEGELAEALRELTKIGTPILGTEKLKAIDILARYDERKK